MGLKHLLTLPIKILVAASVVLASEPQEPGATTLKIDVDLVLVTASVTDTTGRFVPGLGPEQFQIWEDKIQQKVEYFSTEEIPASIGIVFDVSGSMEDKISFARDAAVSFLKNGNRDDEYFLVEFSDEAHVTQDFTSDVSRLQNHLIFAVPKGSTALLDAIYLAAEKVRHGRNPRKAILVITDGEDNRSRYRISDVVEFLKEADIQILAIGILDRRAPPVVPPPSLSQSLHFNGATFNTAAQVPAGEFIRVSPAERLIGELVNVSGGTAFFPDSIDELEEICAKLALQLKNQYVLGYISTNANKDGKWRKLRVKVSPIKGMKEQQIRSKTGYYAPKGVRP